MRKSQRLRRLGGCRRFARREQHHAETLCLGDNLFRKTRKWTIVVREGHALAWPKKTEAVKPQPKHKIGTTNGHEWTLIKSPRNTLNKQKSLAAGPTNSCMFCLYIMNYERWNVNGSGSSAVVVASRGGNSIMRKLNALEKIFSEKQENER